MGDTTSPKEYFKNVIGVTKFKGSKPERVILKFSNQQAPYVISQPLHESQKIEEQNDDYTIISLEVHNSIELQILLLGWNKEVEVLEPKKLRNEIKAMIEGAFNQYT